MAQPQPQAHLGLVPVHWGLNPATGAKLWQNPDTAGWGPQNPQKSSQMLRVQLGLCQGLSGLSPGHLWAAQGQGDIPAQPSRGTSCTQLIQPDGVEGQQWQGDFKRVLLEDGDAGNSITGLKIWIHDSQSTRSALFSALLNSSSTWTLCWIHVEDVKCWGKEEPHKELLAEAKAAVWNAWCAGAEELVLAGVTWNASVCGAGR